jgi:hypothetical protein
MILTKRNTDSDVIASKKFYNIGQFVFGQKWGRPDFIYLDCGGRIDVSFRRKFSGAEKVWNILASKLKKNFFHFVIVSPGK